MQFIREHPCLICSNPNTVPHHEGLGKNAQGAKPPDSHAVPLCVECHERRHSFGVDTFWGGYDVKMHIIELLGEYLVSLYSKTMTINEIRKVFGFSAVEERKQTNYLPDWARP